MAVRVLLSIGLKSKRAGSVLLVFLALRIFFRKMSFVYSVSHVYIYSEKKHSKVAFTDLTDSHTVTHL